MRQIWLGLGILFLLSGIVLGFRYWSKPKAALFAQKDESSLKDAQKTYRMIIFVHGTFGAVTGLLSLPSIVRDKLTGSLYKKMVRRLRKEHFFYSSQPLLTRGLVKFDPSFENNDEQKFYAVHPVSKSFDLMSTQTKNAHEARHYYAFGWSGLLSQSRRRKESVRFLNEEVEKLRKNGITPKITILCHSHGGNVALNMGILANILRGEKNIELHGIEHEVALKENYELLQSLPARESALTAQKQKRWDYKPSVPDWCVDQLVLLASPLQPETDFGALSPFFSSVYNCYSNDDHIQTKDWLSTSRYFSERRFDRIEKILRLNGQILPSKLTQVRIMLNREILSEENKIVSGMSFFVDPGHKEFWFLVFPRNVARHVVKPLPIVCFFPVIHDLLTLVVGNLDVDVNIASRYGQLWLSAHVHGQTKILETKQIAKEFFAAMRDSIYGWKQRKSFFAGMLQDVHLL